MIKYTLIKIILLSESNNFASYFYMTNEDIYYIAYFKTYMSDSIKIVVRVRPFNAN